MSTIGRQHHGQHFCEIILNLGVMQEKMSFKDISYLELWRPLCSAEQNHLCNFGTRGNEERFCEIILNFDRWFRRCCLKDFLSRAMAALLFGELEPFVQFLLRAI